MIQVIDIFFVVVHTFGKPIQTLLKIVANTEYKNAYFQYYNGETIVICGAFVKLPNALVMHDDLKRFGFDVSIIPRKYGDECGKDST